MARAQALDGETLGNTDYFAYTFVRDPLQRFVSLYNMIFPVADWDVRGEALCTWGCEHIWNGEGAGVAPRFPLAAAEVGAPTQTVAAA